MKKNEIGDTGKNLEKFLNKLGRTVYPNGHKQKKPELIPVYNTEITQCYPGKGKKGDRVPDTQEIQNCLNKGFLKNEIDLIKPKILFLMGKTSYEAYFQFILGIKPQLTLSKYIDKITETEILIHIRRTKAMYIIPMQHASSANPRFNAFLKNSILIDKILGILE